MENIHNNDEKSPKHGGARSVRGAMLIGRWSARPVRPLTFPGCGGFHERLRVPKLTISGCHLRTLSNSVN